jgi:UDP-N-acetylglucosamine 2-epimerase (non-hydrolysing)
VEVNKRKRILKIANVVGARPNFMKIAPLMDEYKKYSSIHPILIHTGQHYEEEMSDLFFKELEIPKPDIHLGVGSASHAVQTAEIMKRLEPVLVDTRPDLVVVVGDVNSTIACALTSVKLCIPVAHVEAGLRSFDRTMPEEINRVLTDAISDYLFTTERSANENLIKEGIETDKIFFVGNVMIDTLLRHRKKAENSHILRRIGLDNGMVAPYAVLTMHRPSNVDQNGTFQAILKGLLSLSEILPIIFPAHPRTKKQIELLGLKKYFIADPPNTRPRKGIHLINPLGYLDFLHLMSNSKMVLTDSGGMQEETTVLGVPCLTLRNNTERPVTIDQGTNVLVGSSKDQILSKGTQVLNGGIPERRTPKLWDGRAAERIVNIILRRMIKQIRDKKQ